MTVENKRPNILIYMTDQEQAQVTRPDHPCRTPRLDEIAKQGVRFNSVYPPMAHCCPSRASFMSGMYPSQHGIWNNVANDQALNREVKPGVEMFSEHLKTSGYQLFYGGKWHVSYSETPADRGWTELQSYRSGSYDGGKRREMYRHLTSEQDQPERQNGAIRRPGWREYQLYGTSPKQVEELHDSMVVQRAIQQLDQLKDQQQPWCMFIGMTGPHDPFRVPEPYASMYDPDEVPLPPNYDDALEDKPGLYRRMRKVFSQLSEREVRESIAHYWGYCTMMDDLFGQVVDTLKDTGQYEDTIILFVSDHGELGGAHGLYLKGIPTFDEGYRVPLVISPPKWVKQPGREVDEFVTLMDIAPTLSELGKAPISEGYSGASLVPFLLDEAVPADWRDSVYFQCNGTELYYVCRAVTTKQYKFVYHPSDRDELYDLEKDPHELVNRADDPEMAVVLKQMYKKMWQHAFDTEDMVFPTYPTVTTGTFGPGIIND